MNDLETRLHDAGRALRDGAERTSDVDAGWADLTARLQADPDGSVVVRTGDPFDRAPSWHHRWLAAAAAILVVLGAVGTFVALTDPTDEPTASGGPLFLLPEAGSGYEVSNGFVEVLDQQTVDAHFEVALESVAFGTPSGDGYRDLTVVHLYDGIAPGDAELYGEDVDRQTVTTPRGDVVVTETGFAWQITRQVDGAWLRMDRFGAFSDPSTEDDWVEQAIELLTAAEVVNGSIVVGQPPRGLQEVARERTARAPDAPSVSYQVGGEGIVAGDDGTLATINVVDVPTSIVLLSAMTTSFIEPFTIDGRDGWHATRPDGWQAVVWRADGGQLVAVSGDEELAALLRLAESLVPVDESTWRTATGAEVPVLTSTTPQP